ncbi:hypothetical protein [Brevibacillus daliensis]|nr:hypothetical protein [Brevibacillus daliensis]
MRKSFIVLTLLALTLFSSSFNVANLNTSNKPVGVQPDTENPLG